MGLGWEEGASRHRVGEVPVWECRGTGSNQKGVLGLPCPSTWLRNVVPSSPKRREPLPTDGPFVGEDHSLGKGVSAAVEAEAGGSV